MSQKREDYTSACLPHCKVFEVVINGYALLGKLGNS